MRPNDLTPAQMREARESAKLTRVQLAVLMGSTSSKVTRMENRDFLDDDERNVAFRALVEVGALEDDTIAPVDPFAWLTTARPGDAVIVYNGTVWVVDRYRLAAVKETAIDVIDQRNGATRSFRPERVRPVNGQTEETPTTG